MKKIILFILIVGVSAGFFQFRGPLRNIKDLDWTASRLAWINDANEVNSVPELYWDDTNDRLGIGAFSTGAKLYVSGGYVDILLSGKNGLGGSAALQTLSDAKTIGDSLDWNFNLTNSADASANYAKFVIGITDPAAGAMKGYFSVHTVGAADGIAERFRINDLGDVIIENLTASRLIASSGADALTSSDLIDWIDTNDANYLTVTDDLAGGVILDVNVSGITPAETDPCWTAWLAGPPNISVFTNDAGYLTTVDISANTNLAVADLLTLTDDTLDANTATPANGDTKHLATGDQIYDFVIGLGYITSDPNTHAAATVTDSQSINLTLSGQQITADVNDKDYGDVVVSGTGAVWSVGNDSHDHSAAGSTVTINAADITDLSANTDITADLEEETHASEHAVSGADTAFPADPAADKYLMWDDDPGVLVWSSPAGTGDMEKATYDVLEDGFVDGNDTAYAASWDGNINAPSMNAVYDKIEALPAGHDAVTVTDSQSINLTLSTQDITADVNDKDYGDITVSNTGATWAVDNDSHDHTSSTLSGIDISADTNLTAGTHVSLTDDTVDTLVALVTNGDDVNLPTCDNVYDFVTGLGYITGITGENLDDLSDVNTTGVSGNQVLTYDANDSAWKAKDATGGGSGFSWSSVPASRTAAGTAGDMAYDSTYLYICIANNLWKRERLSVFPSLEDYTGYTEVDEGADITVAAAKIDFTALPRNVTSYVYKDEGAAHFSGDFEHRFSCNIASGAVGLSAVALWMVANDLGDYAALTTAEKSFVRFVSLYNPSGADNFQLLIRETAATTGNDTSIAYTAGVTYFVRIVRDDDGGATNKGQYTAYIATGNYDDEDCGVLFDTLVADCSAEQNDFRYIYALCSYDDALTNNQTGYVQNLDLGE